MQSALLLIIHFLSPLIPIKSLSAEETILSKEYDLHVYKGIINFLSFFFALTSFLILSGCSQTGSDGMAHVSISFGIPSANNKVLSAPVPSGITSITIEVSAPDMALISKGISVTAGDLVMIDLDIPSGSGRKFVAKASDAQGNLLFNGETTLDLIAGVPTTVKIDMVAITAALTVNITGTGSGTVTSSPAGIDCGTACSASFSRGTAVTLTATPAAGSTFAGWSGDPDCTDGAVTMDANKSCTATFNIQTFTLVLTKAGTGDGTVTSSPAGINCGATCSASFNIGTVVTLTAAPAAGSTFAGWSGGGCTGAGTCTVTMTAAASVTATFNIQTPISVTVIPGSVNLLAGSTQQFTATVTGTTNQSVNWSVDGGTANGTVSSTGLYTAPSIVPTPNTVTVRATSMADTTKSGTAQVTIQAVVVGCVAPTIPGFGPVTNIFSGPSGIVDGPVTTAAISITHATGIANDANNNLFVAAADPSVRKIDLKTSPATVSTIATLSAMTAAGASFSLQGITLLPNGDIIVANTGSSKLFRVTQTGTVTIFAGSTFGFADGTALTAQFKLGDAGVTVDGSGNVIVADSQNNRIRKIDTAGNVTTIAGTGVAGSLDGPVSTATFNFPSGVIVDCNGNILVAEEFGNKIRRIIMTGPNAGNVVTVAGNGGFNSVDNVDPLLASFSAPIALSVDSGNNIIVSDHNSGTFRLIAAGSNTPGADGTAPNGAVTSPLGLGQPGSPLEYIAFKQNGSPVAVINIQKIVSLGP